MTLKWQEAPLPSLMPGKRHSLFTIAFHFFPTSFLAKSIAVTLTTCPLIFNYLLTNYGIESYITRGLLTGAIVGAAPTVALYLITLMRAPRIRRREEIEEQRLQHVAHGDLTARKAKEQKEELEVVRLQEVASGDLKARGVKDRKEDDRWELLNESLRLQKETVELATEERLLVAQQVKDIKDEGEVMRKGLASDDLEARHIKDLKEDKRWAVLNESLRLQKESEELASEERLIVAQQVKDVKEEGETMRKGLASDDLEARHIKEDKEEKRWTALYERLRIQEERSDEREKRQILRDEEQIRMRREDEARDKYKILFARYIRNSPEKQLNREVADGLAPIPDEWLNAQPEILKNPALMQLIAPHNEC